MAAQRAGLTQVLGISAMESDVPTNCPKCGTPLLPRNVHRFGVAIGVEVAFGLVLLAFFVPVLWARVALAVPGLALLAFAFASSKTRSAGRCPDCDAKIVQASGSADV